ncbi:MAG: glycosyltransferase family 9 protein [Pirellulaceae bacterium]
MKNQPEHILITRLSAIGDCIATLPLAAAIRDAMPDVRISWAVSCAAKDLLNICPDIDCVIPVSKRYLKEPRNLGTLRRTLREHAVDCVIDPQSLSKSAVLGRLSGAPLRIGFAQPRGRELAPWLNNVSIRAEAGMHLIDAQAKLLEPLGIKPTEPTFRLNVPEPTVAWAIEHVAERVDHHRPVIMNPGAGWDSRLWPTDRFGKVAAWLKQQHQLPTLIVWAGEEERRMAEEIRKASSGAAIVAGETSLVELAALLMRAEVFISSDTGPMHLAVAVGSRCLSLHGPTRPEMSGPYGSRHLSIQKQYVEGGSRERRSAGNEAMQLICVADVCDGLTKMLSKHKSAAA